MLPRISTRWGEHPQITRPPWWQSGWSDLGAFHELESRDGIVASFLPQRIGVHETGASPTRLRRRPMSDPFDKLRPGSADRHRHLPVHRHRGQHPALGARLRPAMAARPGPPRRPAAPGASRPTAATSSRPSATPSAPPSPTAAGRPRRRPGRPAAAGRPSVGRERPAAGADGAAHRRGRARDGDYFGPPLNRVARLLAAGHGGQVLLSRTAGELVRDALPEGARLRDLGEHRLKDLLRPGAASSSCVHPTCRPTSRRCGRSTPAPTTCRCQPTPLIGRERGGGSGA